MDFPINIFHYYLLKSFQNSNRKQFDLLGTFGAAFNYKNIRLFGGYRLGLLDLDKSDNVTVKTSGLFFGLGYKL